MAYLGDLGGLIDIIYIVGGLLTAIFTRHALQSALITDSYQIQKFNHDESEYYPTKGGTEAHLLTSFSDTLSDSEAEREKTEAEKKA